MTLKSLLETLNLSDKDGLFSNADLSNSTTLFLPNRLKDSLKKIDPDYFFCINNEPLILFLRVQKIQKNYKNKFGILINHQLFLLIMVKNGL